MNYTNCEFLSLSKEILDSGEILRFPATGYSMDPFIRDGEVIHVLPAHERILRYADIVLFHDQDKKLFIHRILKRRKNGGRTAFLVKGDAVPRPDGDIAADDIIGKVIAVEKGKRLLSIDKGVFKIINILYALLLPASRRACLLFDRCVKRTG